MKVGRSLQKVLDELEEIGVSERKILNYLKKYKNDMELELKRNKKNDIVYNSIINDMIFDGRFDILNPTNELLNYLTSIKKEYGGDVLYYSLTRVLDDNYYRTGKIHSMNDIEKCRVIMYFLKQNLPTYVEDFVELNRVYYDENLTGDDYDGYQKV